MKAMAIGAGSFGNKNNEKLIPQIAYAIPKIKAIFLCCLMKSPGYNFSNTVE